MRYVKYDDIDYKGEALVGQTNLFKRGAQFVLDRANKAESIDIVRCRECAKWTNGDDVAGICQWNEYRTLQTWADSFCSFGVRRESRR